MKLPNSTIVASCFLLVCVLAVQAVAAVNDAGEHAYQVQVQPLLKKYCYGCHGGANPESDLDLQATASSQAVLEGRSTWLKVMNKLRAGEMPPKEAHQPSADERKFLSQWFDDTLNNIDCSVVSNPGRVTIRRLNRIEYRNTIRDLLGVDYQPADDFPADDVGYGFDNIGDVLSLPPILMEKYLTAAEDITGKAIVTDHRIGPKIQRFDAADLQASGGSNPLDEGGRIIFSQGEIYTQFDVPADGQYLLRSEAFGQQAGDEPAKMAFRVDGRDVHVVSVTATESQLGKYEFRTQLKAGGRRVGVAFINDFYNPQDKNPDHRDRNLIVRQLEISGPLNASSNLPETHQRVFVAQPDDKTPRREAARIVLERLATRAYRRPVSSAELDRLLQLVDLADRQGDRFESTIQLALQALLVSPHFLYKVELPAETKQADGVFELNDYQLATNLSYFLWSSMPDDELFRPAREGTLRSAQNLEHQVRRMLQDARSMALVENFAGQWLQLRNLDTMSPDRERFPAFDDKLRTAMRTETETFFATILREDRSIFDLLDADFTFVNEQLAQHYGFRSVKGDEFRRVSLRGTPRRGVLTQASVLTVTSNPTRTSPVKRGKWVLENLLGTPPPPPAPDVQSLDEQTALTGTLRQRMEQHRADPRCATCHQRMDPIGFALENFDAIGGWRTRDDNLPIDASGQLPSGEKFDGPLELKALLVGSRREDFVRCLIEKMLTYALGRGLEYYDQCAVDQIAAALGRDNYRFSTLIVEIVRSDPFQKRSMKRSQS